MPGARFQFRDTWYQLAPPWLQTDVGEKYMYTLELLRDVSMERCYQAVAIRFPGVGDVSQLPYLAHDRQLLQGPNESDAAFLERMPVAFQTWAACGNRTSVLQQLGYYIQGMNVGPPPSAPLMSIVGGSYPTVATWDVVRIGDALGSVPTRTKIAPSDFNWDGGAQPWRSWLVLHQTLVAVPGLAGAAAATGAATASACFAEPGRTVSGVVVPSVSGTPVDSPWLAVTGLSGLTSAQVGQYLTLSGSAHALNNGNWQIVSVQSATSCTVANPLGTAHDAGPLAWSVSEYPWIAPAMVWGAPGTVFGQGETQAPPLDLGTIVGGVLQPTTDAPPNAGPSASWGLSCSSGLVDRLRGIVKTWKSGPTWYVNLVVSFAGHDLGLAGSEYSPLSSPGGGNPNGQNGGVGRTVAGVLVPEGLLVSPFTAYCQGTGTWNACSVPNMT
jgi:hypothetical protein